MDWGFIGKYLPLYAAAVRITIGISFFGIVASLIVGLICTVVVQAKTPVLRQCVSVYVELSRNTPLLVQLFLIYFGLTKIGIKMDAEVAAVVGLTFLGGSYMAEALRSGLVSHRSNRFGMWFSHKHFPYHCQVLLPIRFS